jgi:8-oxo-dGTP pyrophosphatase MutT (NUDIX family)
MCYDHGWRGPDGECPGCNCERPAMKKYVVGFLLSDDLARVAVIRKLRPQWQVGLLNGIGGRIEPGEEPLVAMNREFHEEAGVHVGSWHHVLTLRFPYAEIDFFASANSALLERVRTVTDEEILTVSVDGISGTIPNIPALLELSRQRLTDVELDKRWKASI